MKNLDKLFDKYNIDQLANGCSSGNNWFGSGEVIKSVSPENSLRWKFKILRFIQNLH